MQGVCLDFFEFERAVLRLKEVTKVQTDKDLAALLGMELSAFNKRKARGSFPVERVRALAEQQPELGIDVQHVLTGVSQRAATVKLVASADAAIAELTREARAAGQLPPSFEPDFLIRGDDGVVAVVELKGGSELSLLRNYRNAEPAGRRAIEATAEAVTKGAAQATTLQASEPTSIRQRFDAAVGQVSGRDIVNSGGKVNVRTPAKKK
jgi:hypothetical protein